MKLSIIVPHFNEGENLINFCEYISHINFLKEFEVLFVDDYSNDESKISSSKLAQSYSQLRFINNKFDKGLGGTIRSGILESKGEFVAIMMCDSSDTLEDLEKYYKEIQANNFDAILGSRFTEGSKIKNYPFRKLILNRIFNYFVKIIFWSNYNDFTNAFKIYKKKALLDIMPLVSESFNIFLEIPLKIISRQLKYKIIPISWENKRIGKSNFKIQELGSKYFFTLIYCFFEKSLIIKRKRK